MKYLAGILWILCVAAPLKAEDWTTAEGKTYKNVTVTKTDPDGIHILYDGGCGKIPFSQLPSDLQKKYGYDPKKAAGFAAAEVQRETASDALVRAANLQNKRKEAQAELHSGSSHSLSSLSAMAADAPLSDAQRSSLTAQIQEIDRNIDDLQKDRQVQLKEAGREFDQWGNRLSSSGGASASAEADQTTINQLWLKRDQLEGQLNGGPVAAAGSNSGGQPTEGGVSGHHSMDNMVH